MISRYVMFASLFVGALVFSQTGMAAEVKVLSANVFTGILDNVFSDFEHSSGHKVQFEYVTAGKVRDRVQAGEPGDVAITTRAILDDLEKGGKIVDGTSANLAHSAVALVVGKGAAKPDISSIDSFKHLLLAVGSISYPDPTRGGATGILFGGIVDRLGITADIKTKTKFPQPGHFAVELVANGEAEAAIAQPMEALLQPGVEIAGLLPAELQSPKNFTFAVGVLTTAKESDAARSLIKYLVGPSVQSMLKTKGMEPGQRD